MARVSIRELCPVESAVRLKNPERGWYVIAKFLIEDAMGDVRELVDALYVPEEDDLLLVEVNLAAYAAGPISELGIAHITRLFESLVARGNSLVVRFLYDWEGKCRIHEPRELGIVRTHLEQLGPVMRPFGERVYCYQGLLVGNWGEMHGTRYGGADLAVLHRAMREAFGREAFLSVRTPALWRALAGSAAPSARTSALRLGLFNDGMLGSVSDLGTYGTDGTSEADARERELDFQDKLCRFVPNGGEVVGASPVSDYERAVRDLARMHVSYLNRAHDRAVLDKWARHRVMGSGPWQGADGLAYVEGHLGYRYAITRVSLGHGMLSGRLSRSMHMRVVLENRGFAPIYHRVTLWASVKGAEGVRSFCLDGAIEPGSPNTLAARANLPLAAFGTGECELYLLARSEKYGRQIALAHDGQGDLGYLIGEVVVS